MLSSLPFKVRVLTTLSTAVIGMIKEDSRTFIINVLERLRLAQLPGISRALSKVVWSLDSRDQTRALIQKGRLYAAAQPPSGMALPFSAKRASEMIQQLTQKIPKGKSAKLAADGCNPRPLFFLTNSVPFTTSGYTERSHNLLRALRDQCIPVAAVTRFGYPVLVGKLPPREIQEIDGIQYERIISTLYPRSLSDRDDAAVRELVRIGKKRDVNILHTTTDYKNAVVVSRAASLLGVPWIYEVRGELEKTWLSRFPTGDQASAKESDFYRLAHEQETNAMKNASAVIALSEVSRRAMMKRGIPGDRIIVVPNAINESLLKAEYDQRQIRQELNLPPGPIVGCITSIVGYEGLDDLIRATADLPEVKCLIVGEGAARPQLEMLAARLGVTDQVIFAGRQPTDEIWKWYAALDVFVIPRKDTDVTRVVTPLKGLNAQALGKPIVASDIPALREVTGNLGVYFPAGDVSELSRAVRDALTNPQYGHAEWAATRTWNENAKVLVRLYRKLLGSRDSDDLV